MRNRLNDSNEQRAIAKYVLLIKLVLQVEEATTDDTDIRALPYVLALHAFCTVDPTLCSPPSDPSRFAVTLQPYLKTQVHKIFIPIPPKSFDFSS